LNIFFCESQTQSPHDHMIQFDIPKLRDAGRSGSESPIFASDSILATAQKPY
jgi:hypothetical protein